MPPGGKPTSQARQNWSTNMTGPREQALRRAANLLLDARRTGSTLADLPAHTMPDDIAEACFVQDVIAASFGPIGGWKIGAAAPDATPLFAPMPAAWMGANGAILRGPRWRLRGIEAEIAFLVGEDLPPRPTPYTREEVLAAMASCHPAIEVLESGLTDPGQAARNAAQADLQVHGGFVPGPPVPDWHAIDFSQEAVSVAVDGMLRVERTGSNTSGDLVRLLPWLANEGAARTGGLRRGQWITTGSWTGSTPAGPASGVTVRFGSAGEVTLRFES
jgi:2-keto-4-pentenoate hydratase